MRRTSGFTLIELIVMILIITLVALFFGIKTPSVSLYSLSSITEQLRRDIRYTQTLATSLNTNYSIILSTNSYTIAPNPPNGAYSVSMPTGITLSSVSITFNSMGAPASGASITITASGVGTNTLTVSAETGFVNG
ncbi:prepilin-type N-terminal cleavage/methylation domain-containing protein [Legionella sp. WA2022007384]